MPMSGTPEEIAANEEANRQAIAANPDLAKINEQAKKEAEEESIRLGFSVRDPVTGKLVPKAKTADSVIAGLKVAGVVGGIGVGILLISKLVKR